ncbi:MAG: DUF447 family protein [Phycisphaeraceae bacterium]|nr:DUF447 family protein [Phycisphaeraceae bacterium]
MSWQRPQDWPVIEGIVTTLSTDEAEGADAPGRGANLAPMGPIVAPDFSEMVLRPFAGSTTLANLQAHGEAVFHVTDDAALIARGVIGSARPGENVQVQPAREIDGMVVKDACRVLELKVRNLDDSTERSVIEADVVADYTLRPFVGFNRARHAVLEAAILASRVHLTGVKATLDEMAPFQVWVDKTGTDAERAAMVELREYVEGTGETPG